MNTDLKYINHFYIELAAKNSSVLNYQIKFSFELLNVIDFLIFIHNKYD